MNEIVFVNKKKDMTSFDVCNKIRKALKLKKVGHTGTLDPNATGLMILLFQLLYLLYSIHIVFYHLL